MRVLLLFASVLMVMFFTVSGAVAAVDDIVASIEKSRPVVENRRSPLILHLKHVGTNFPVMPEELEFSRGHKMHLFMVDPSLTDFHYKNPNAMESPGHYIFTMIPHTPCGYKLWIEIDTVNNDREFVKADIDGADDCKDLGVKREYNLDYADQNFSFLLEFDTPGLRVGQPTMARLTVREKDGRYVRELQPFRGDFAHIIGFYDDYETITHLHPVSGQPEEVLGGPSVMFQITPEKRGYLKLFAQVKINGNIIDVPFGVDVVDDIPRDIPMDNMYLPTPEDISIEDILGREGLPEEEVYDSGLEERARTPRQEENNEQDDLSDLFSEPEEDSGDVYEDPNEELLRSLESMPVLKGYAE